jgi:hypothetical protein
VRIGTAARLSREALMGRLNRPVICA